MQKALFAGSLLVAALPDIAASAITCTHQRDICVAGEKSRAQYVAGTSSCDCALPVCLNTGVWDAGGRYGRRIEGMIKR
jgi:hypothetical protein